jgi:hypothetical protein
MRDTGKLTFLQDNLIVSAKFKIQSSNQVQRPKAVGILIFELDLNFELRVLNF